MSSKKAVIKIGSDVEEAKKGIDSINKQLDSLAYRTKKSSFMQIAGNVATIGKAFDTVSKVVKTVNAEIKETTDLYKKQATAEKQLEVAAKNNPYLDPASVIQLKDYASQLQNISTVGDEELIPMMAQLAAAGRTQSEIQDIMSAALDVSASGMMSLDTAVSSLNKTFSGSAGTLGNQITAIKSLTQEELKSGKAVKIVAEQFKGMAKETAEATGSSEQLKNAIGDYKELWGETFENALSPMRRYFTNLISNITNARKKQREFNNAVKEVYDENGNIKTNAKQDSLSIILQQRREELSELRDALREVNDIMRSDSEAWQYDIANQERRSALLDEINEKQKAANEIEREILKQKEINQKKQAQIDKFREEEARKAEKAAQEEAQRQAKIDAMKRRDDLRTDYEETLRQTQEQINSRKKLGETITEEQEAQLLLNAATQAYINMYSDPAFDRSQTQTGMWAGEQEQIDYINNLAKIAKVEAEIKETTKGHEKELIENWQTHKTESLEMQKQVLSDYEAYLNSKEKLTDEEIALKEKLVDAQKNLDEAILKEQKDNWAQSLSDFNSYIKEFAGISSQITDLARQNNEQQTEEELTEISKQYTEGLISYEEYCEKKKEIDKKAAQEEYKIKMWEWRASLVQATANIAEGVAKAIAQGGVAGIITGSLVAASGALQIATITANKPIAPSFATGGIVPGNSYSGDRVQANVNSGEMILNAQQQRELWKLANGTQGGNGAVVNMPVTIENNMADSAKVDTKLTKDGLIILINGIVNQQMQRGAYTESMGVAQAKEGGLNLL